MQYARSLFRTLPWIIVINYVVGTICNFSKLNHRLLNDIIGCPQLFSNKLLLNFMPLHRHPEQYKIVLQKVKNNPEYHIPSNYAVPCTKSGLLFEVETWRTTEISLNPYKEFFIVSICTGAFPFGLEPLKQKYATRNVTEGGSETEDKCDTSRNNATN